MKPSPLLALPLALLLACDSYEEPIPSIRLSISAGDLGPDYTKVDVVVFANNKQDFAKSYEASQLAQAQTLTLVGGGSGATPTAGTLPPSNIPVSAGNLRVLVTASSGTKSPVSRTHEVSLPGSGTRLLQIILVPECAGVSCTLGQTCDKGANCITSKLDVNALPAVRD